MLLVIDMVVTNQHFDLRFNHFKEITFLIFKKVLLYSYILNSNLRIESIVPTRLFTIFFQNITYVYCYLKINQLKLNYDFNLLKRGNKNEGFVYYR